MRSGIFSAFLSAIRRLAGLRNEPGDGKKNYCLLLPDICQRRPFLSERAPFCAGCYFPPLSRRLPIPAGDVKEVEMDRRLFLRLRRFLGRLGGRPRTARQLQLAVELIVFPHILKAVFALAVFNPGVHGILRV